MALGEVRFCGPIGRPSALERAWGARWRVLRRRAGIGALCLVARFASAQTPPELELRVARGPGAEDCSDAPALRAAIAARGVSVEGPVSLDVWFDRQGDEYIATVHASGARSGVRSLSVRDSQCAPLVEALTISMVLLLDPTASVDEEPVAAEAEPPADVAAAPRAAETEATQTTEPEATTVTPETPDLPPAPDWSRPYAGPVVSLFVAPRIAFGLAPAVAAGIEAGARARWDWFSLSIGVSAFLPRSKDFAGGQATGWFAAARASLCAHWTSGSDIDLAGCGTVLGALLSVRGSGYDRDETQRQPVVALGPSAGVSGPFGERWGWWLDGALLFVTQSQTFEVLNAGDAFSVPTVTGSAGAGVWVRIK